MYQSVQRPINRPVRVTGKKTAWVVAFLLSFLPGPAAFSQQTSKVQEIINSIKVAYYCEDQDYHTDGQRTVWVKSYKKWVPQDLEVMKKEAPDILLFLNKAILHNRYDVLEQLLPDYYREHGGVKAFTDDIVQAYQNPNTGAGEKSH